MQASNAEAGRTFDISSARDREEMSTSELEPAATEYTCSPKMNVGGAFDRQPSCDWSQPSVGGAMDRQSSFDWSQPSVGEAVDDQSSCDWSQPSVGGVIDAQSSYDWSQPAGHGAMDSQSSFEWLQPSVGGAMDRQASCDWSVGGYEGVKYCAEESMQSMDADDEQDGSSSSSSDEEEDWQEVEGLYRRRHIYFLREKRVLAQSNG